jgi:hypothetical protein
MEQRSNLPKPKLAVEGILYLLYLSLDPPELEIQSLC